MVEGVTAREAVSDAAEQAALLGQIEGIEPAVGIELGGLRHDVRLTLLARHGGDLQQVDHVLRQPRDAPGHQLADRFGRAEVRRDGSVTLLVGLFLAVPELPEHFVEEERVAVGQPAELGDEIHRGLGPVARQGRHGRRAQAPQVHRLDGECCPAVRQHRTDRVVGRHLGVAVHRDDPEPFVVGASQDVAQQQQRRRVRPVQVVDDQQGWSGARKVVQRGRDCFEESEAAALCVAAARLERRRVLIQAGHEPGQLCELPVRHV